MAISYNQTANAATSGNIVACSGAVLVGSNQEKTSLCTVGGTPAAADVTVGGSAFDVGTGQAGVMMEIEPAANVIWTAGTWTVRLNVRTAQTLVTWASTYICRLNAAGASQATIGSNVGHNTSLAATGVKTVSVTGGASTPVAGDSVMIVLVFDVITTANQTLVIRFDQAIDTPFITATPLTPTFSDAWGNLADTWAFDLQVLAGVTPINVPLSDAWGNLADKTLELAGDERVGIPDDVSTAWGDARAFNLGTPSATTPIDVVFTADNLNLWVDSQVQQRDWLVRITDPWGNLADTWAKDLQVLAGVPLIDSFTRANSGNLGANFTAINNTGGGDGPGILNEQVYRDVIDQYDVMVWNAATFGPNAEVYIDYVTLNTSGTDSPAVEFLPDLGNYRGYEVGVLTALNGLYITRIDGVGVEVELVSVPQTISAGDGFGLRRVADKIELWYRSGPAGTWTRRALVFDSTYTGVGSLAFYAPGDDTDWRLDNFAGATVVNDPTIDVPLSDAWGNLVDLLGRGHGYNLADTALNLLDSFTIARTAALTISLSDNLNLWADQAPTFFRTGARTVSLPEDLNTWADSPAVLRTGALTISLSDNLNLWTDSYARSKSYALTDSWTNLADQIAAGLPAIYIWLADDLNQWADARSVTVTGQAALTCDFLADSLNNWADSPTALRTGALAVSLSDNLNVWADSPAAFWTIQLTLPADNVNNWIDQVQILRTGSLIFAVTDPAANFADILDKFLGGQAAITIQITEPIFNFVDSSVGFKTNAVTFTDPAAGMADKTLVLDSQHQLEFQDAIPSATDQVGRTLGIPVSGAIDVSLSDNLNFWSDQLGLLLWSSLLTFKGFEAVLLVDAEGNPVIDAEGNYIVIDTACTLADTLDAVVTGLTARTATFTDTWQNLADNRAALVTYAVPFTDSWANLADALNITLTGQAALTATFTDSWANLTDNRAAFFTYSKAITDTWANEADQFAALRTGALAVALSDSAANFGDSIGLFRDWLVRLSDSAVNLADAIQLTSGGDRFIQLSEDLNNFVDSAKGFYTIAAKPVDIWQTLDDLLTPLKSLGYSLPADAGGANWADARERTLGKLYALSDAWGNLGDQAPAFTRIGNLVAGLADSAANLADQIEAFKSFSAQLSDDANNYVDQVAQLYGLIYELADDAENFADNVQALILAFDLLYIQVFDVWETLGDSVYSRRGLSEIAVQVDASIQDTMGISLIVDDDITIDSGG